MPALPDEMGTVHKRHKTELKKAQKSSHNVFFVRFCVPSVPLVFRSRSRWAKREQAQRRSRTNASSISEYVKFALRPLGFGNTNTAAP